MQQTTTTTYLIRLSLLDNPVRQLGTRGLCLPTRFSNSAGFTHFRPYAGHAFLSLIANQGTLPRRQPHLQRSLDKISSISTQTNDR